MRQRILKHGGVSIVCHQKEDPGSHGDFFETEEDESSQIVLRGGGGAIMTVSVVSSGVTSPGSPGVVVRVSDEINIIPTTMVVSQDNWRVLVSEVDAMITERTDCPGFGLCHGTLKWCSFCGDVRVMCDDASCSVHHPCWRCSQYPQCENCEHKEMKP